MQYSLPCVGPYAIGPFAFINVKRYCGFFAVSIILKFSYYVQNWYYWILKISQK